MANLGEGDIAPGFTLPLDDGSMFQLSAQRGRPVVLYFYTEDYSGGCVD